MELTKAKDLPAGAAFEYAGEKYVKVRNDLGTIICHDLGYPSKMRMLPQFVTVTVLSKRK